MGKETAQERKRLLKELGAFGNMVRGIASYKRAWEILGGHLLLVRGMPVLATDGFRVAKHVTGGVLYHFWMAAIGMLVSECCWSNYSSWMRTMNISRTPSEWVMQHVLRKTFAELLADASKTPNWVKFIRERMDLKRYRPAA